MSLDAGVVLVTRCGCKRYVDWPAWSMKEEIRIPLPYRNEAPWKEKEIDTSPPETRLFRAAAKGVAELIDGDGKMKFYRVYEES